LLADCYVDFFTATIFVADIALRLKINMVPKAMNFIMVDKSTCKQIEIYIPI